MEAFAGELRDGGLGVIIVGAGLFDLLLKVRLVLLGRLQPLRGRFRQALRLFCRLLGRFRGLDRRRNLVVVPNRPTL